MRQVNFLPMVPVNEIPGNKMRLVLEIAPLMFPSPKVLLGINNYKP
jgi:hypothetical protein